MTNLSINLKKLLHNAKISENELARRTGISQQIINRILSGENANPKLATLSPLARYFMISISQLIGDELIEGEMRLNTSHLGWQEIPLIDWSLINTKPLKEIMLLKNNKILVDIKPSKDIFALKLKGDSMEPKFSEGTLLIFDFKKKPTNGDFFLLVDANKKVMVRQFFSKGKISYRKCLNPKYEEYALTTNEPKTDYLGTLIQSRTDYAIR